MIQFQTLPLKAAALCAGLALACIAPAAQASTIDFDSFTPVNSGLPNPVSIDGLSFSNGSFQAVWDVDSGNAFNGTPSFIYGFGGLTLTQTGGGGFFLAALDLGTSFYTQPTGTINYVLNFTGGGTESGTLDLTDTFQTFVFNASVDSVVLGGVNDGYIAVDNINFTGGVPEPTSWALMVLGFGGLGAALRVRRRHALVLA
jgi:hypothetical protein